MNEMFTFNSMPLITYGDSHKQPIESDFPDSSCHYAEFNEAYDNTTDYVRKILDSCIPISSSKQLVDIKVHDLNVGEIPCIPGWHYDGTTDEISKLKIANYHILVTGEACLTEFMYNPYCTNAKTINDLKKELHNYNGEIVKIPSGHWTHYNSFNLHRGSISKVKEKRLLVKITESDMIKAQSSRHYKTTKYKGKY